jgi:holo-[acyl-carrier protein] synthase
VARSLISILDLTVHVRPSTLLVVQGRVGIDLVATADVGTALAAHGDRYLSRAYTEAEVADCTRRGAVDEKGLAGRFAAKEAVKKVLRRDGIPWRSIEVVRMPGGWTSVALSGVAAEHAHTDRIGAISLSITHEDSFAAAVAFAEVAA